VRLVFCLFADDTGIFPERGSFRDWIEREAREDGANLGWVLHELFEILLIIAYRELRMLEMKVLRALYPDRFIAARARCVQRNADFRWRLRKSFFGTIICP